MTNFKHAWTRHTINGRACYFCLTPTQPPSEAPCCIAAHEAYVLNKAYMARMVLRTSARLREV